MIQETFDNTQEAKGAARLIIKKSNKKTFSVGLDENILTINGLSQMEYDEIKQLDDWEYISSSGSIEEIKDLLIEFGADFENANSRTERIKLLNSTRPKLIQIVNKIQP